MFSKIGSYAGMVIPSPEVLHDRAATHYDMIQIEPGNLQRLPRFDSQVAELEAVPEKQRIIKDRHYNILGTRFWDDTKTTDNIDRGVTTYVPDAECVSGYPFTLVMDTAWFTGLEGHNDRIAERFMRELGVSVVVIGPEFSAASPNEIGGEQCLGRLALLSAGFSQMRSMEASSEIYATLLANRPEYGLTPDIVGVGESRGAMGEQIRRLQLQMQGITTIHSDITDPSVNRHALRTKKDLYNLATWPIRETKGSLAVGMALFRHGDLHREVATVPASARYLVGAVVGTGPALLSGEEGMFAGYTPLDHPQHITNFKSNNIAHVADRRRAYEHHSRTTIAELRGPHLGLAYPSVQRRVIDRTHKVGMPLLEGMHPDWSAIHAVGHRDLDVLHKVA